MFKEARLMFIYTETSLHAGSGTSLGVIDLPIQREKYTDYPVLQASGIKGAVRDWFETNNSSEKQKIELIFGPDTIGGGEAFSGAATFTDGRLLLFPVRSMKGVFAYTTSCFALNRLRRDLTMSKATNVNWNIPQEPKDNQVWGIKESGLCEDGKVLLEEYAFDFLGNNNDVKTIAAWLSQNAFPNGPEYQFWKEKVKTDLLILPEDAFKDFVKLSTEVQARIKINNETKTAASGALFYEETLTPDTLLYSVVMANDPFKDEGNRPNGLKNANDVMTFINKLNGNRAQFGGDTTIGRGIVNIQFFNGGNTQQNNSTSNNGGNK
ncbi:MAG: type III-B CRISPR module RAMP protein Cmr4 [Candidatus Brocadia carolinensis]|uniref:Type III-B CRISPR module RAMP protein Cmr4 n=1 Tax=Candidatus Brocadia carolinensis TaxID=1004156 RepID=A0A1V4ARB0_9BACT|nr:MAG: type III-B CRISPR module RAMP protein Cmr4 [Candidatus Brocadia caroliniensis]